MSLDRRLARLELARVASKGIRIFRSSDEITYWESLSEGYDYNETIIGMDGNPPSDGRRMWTQAELDDLDRQGWQVLVICYVNNWREQSIG